MSPELMRLLELSGGVNVTIAGATKKDGNINRKKADRILDPHGYFEKNKRHNRLREYLARIEAQPPRRLRSDSLSVQPRS